MDKTEQYSASVRNESQRMIGLVSAIITACIGSGFQDFSRVTALLKGVKQPVDETDVEGKTERVKYAIEGLDPNDAALASLLVEHELRRRNCTNLANAYDKEYKELASLTEMVAGDPLSDIKYELENKLDEVKG